jgi:hypothetical protein
MASGPFSGSGVARVAGNQPAGKQTRPRPAQGAGLFFAHASLRLSSIKRNLIRHFTKNGPVPTSTLGVARNGVRDMRRLARAWRQVHFPAAVSRVSQETNLPENRPDPGGQPRQSAVEFHCGIQ